MALGAHFDVRSDNERRVDIVTLVVVSNLRRIKAKLFVAGEETEAWTDLPVHIEGRTGLNFDTPWNPSWTKVDDNGVRATYVAEIPWEASISD